MKLTAAPLLLMLCAMQDVRANGDVELDSRVWKAESAGKPYSLTLFPHADEIRFEVRNGDVRKGDSVARERSELRLPEELKAGTCVTFRYLVNLESFGTSNAFQIITQFHSKGSWGNPPWFALYIDPTGNLVARWRSDASLSRRAKPSGEMRFPFTRGKWTSVSISARTGSDDGFLRVQVGDAAPQIFNGPIGYEASGKGAGYPKFGIYRWHADDAEPTVAIFRNVQLETACSDGFQGSQ